MSLTIYNYRILCTTENIYKYVWFDSLSGIPTKCPDNTSHVVDLNSVEVVNKVEESQIVIREEKIPTGGNFKIFSISFDAAPNGITLHNFSLPYNINVLSCSIISRTENLNDIICWSICRDVNIGTISQTVNPTDTLINVSLGTLEDIYVGFCISLDDGINQSIYTTIIALDKNNNTITLETATGYTFASGTNVKKCINMIDKLEIAFVGIKEIGATKIGATYIKTNEPFQCKYENKSTTETRRFTCYIEYLY